MQAASTPVPAEAECKSATSSTIFDHIRKKSKDFPALMVSKSMDSSYEPLILKKMKTSRDQFGVEQSSLHAGGVTPTYSEPAEPRISPTNTAEKCCGILNLNRTSEKSRVLFAGKRDSPSEKTKILTTPGESSLRIAGEKDSPLEKSKILINAPAESSLQSAAKRDSPSEKSKMPAALGECSLGHVGGKHSPLAKSSILIRTPVENSPQFAAKRVSPSAKRKFCFSSPLPCFQAGQCTEQVRAASQPFNIEEYVKEILVKRKESESDDFPFLNCRSVFSFL